MVNGQHFSGTNYQLDGTDNRDPILGIIVINPTLESVGETKITSQNYDAEFGLAVAGVVSVQTRSGTNSLRGSAFEFFQNDALQARNPFTQFQADPLTGRFIPETKRNQFGASIGGPIVQNRWFYFGDYQGTRATQGGSRLLSVPTAAARGGDLSAYGINIYDPQTGQQFDGNRIPTGRLSQQAQRILDLIPTPNATGRDNGIRDNYVAAASESFEENSMNVRDRRAAVGQAQHLRPLQPRRLLPRRSDLVRPGRRPGAGEPGWRLRRPQPQRRSRHGLHDVADDARRLPVRVLPLQGQRAAVRLRHDAGGGRRDSRPEHRLDVRLGTAGRFHRRRRLDGTGRIRVRIGSRRQPLQLPARSGREAVADGRQPDQAAGEPHDQVRHRLPPRLQPARAERRAPIRRADVRERPHLAQRRRRARPGHVPARRRDPAAALRQRQHRRARAAVAALLLRAGHLAREQQDDAQLRAAARHHQPADDQRRRAMPGSST